MDSAWDPFELMDQSPFKSFAQDERAVANIKVDWLETPEAHVFKANLPGLRKEDVKVQLEDERILQVTRERNKLQEFKQGNKWHMVECSHGKFLHRFKLPDDGKAVVVSTKVVDGVLTMTVSQS